MTARSLAPLYLKATLAVREPVNYRNGFLVCLAKPATQVFACESFRSILIAKTCLARCSIAYCAASCCLYFKRTSSPSQAGATPGIPTDSITLLAQTFFCVSRDMGRVPTLLFYDLQAAFYRTLRQSIAPFHDHDRALRKLFYDLKKRCANCTASWSPLRSCSMPMRQLT